MRLMMLFAIVTLWARPAAAITIVDAAYQGTITSGAFTQTILFPQSEVKTTDLTGKPLTMQFSGRSESTVDSDFRIAVDGIAQGINQSLAFGYPGSFLGDMALYQAGYKIYFSGNVANINGTNNSGRFSMVGDLVNGEVTGWAGNFRMMFPGFATPTDELYDFSFVLSDGRATVAGLVPEPTTWALMIVGLGLVGVAMRRQRSAIAVPG